VTPAERALEREQRLQQALELAFAFLGRRERTMVELRRCLERRGVDRNTAVRAVEVLSADGYLDDARYAERFAQDKRELEHWGAERIARRLLALGVSPEVVEATLEQHGPDAELRAAVALLERRLPTPPRDGRERNRALGLLVRRGYELELACDAIRAHERGELHA
jgi:regulatory protein